VRSSKSDELLLLVGVFSSSLLAAPALALVLGTIKYIYSNLRRKKEILPEENVFFGEINGQQQQYKRVAEGFL